MKSNATTTFDVRAQKEGRVRKGFFWLCVAALAVLTLGMIGLEINLRAAPLPLAEGKKLGSLPLVTVKVEGADYFHAGYSLYEDNVMKAYYYYIITPEDDIIIYRDPQNLPDPVENSLAPPFYFTGRAQKMPDGDYEEYIGWLVEEGASEDYARAHLLRYELRNNGQGTHMGMIIYLLIAFALFWGARSGLKAHQKAVAALSHYGHPALMKEALDGELPTGKAFGPLTITESFLFTTRGPLLLLPLRETVWAYVNQVNHRTYGITTGKSFHLNLCASDRLVGTIMMKEWEARGVLEALAASPPCKAAIGYNAARQQLWAKDPQRFIAMWKNGEFVAQTSEG